MNPVEVYAQITFAEDEKREGPGRIKGTLLTYGERASDRNVTFADNSLSWTDGGVVLNLQHQRHLHLARFMPAASGKRLMVDVPLPDTAASRDAVTLIKAGVLTGLSAEVEPMSEDYDGTLRRITKGMLTGAALVDGPSFKGSKVSVHAKRGRGRRLWL